MNKKQDGEGKTTTTKEKKKRTKKIKRVVQKRGENFFFSGLTKVKVILWTTRSRKSSSEPS